MEENRWACGLGTDLSWSTARNVLHANVGVFRLGSAYPCWQYQQGTIISSFTSSCSYAATVWQTDNARLGKLSMLVFLFRNTDHVLGAPPPPSNISVQGTPWTRLMLCPWRSCSAYSHMRARPPVVRFGWSPWKENELNELAHPSKHSQPDSVLDQTAVCHLD